MFNLGIKLHILFEIFAYSAGFQLYLRLRKQQKQVTISFEQSFSILAGCIIGALLGSKVLSWLENPLLYWANRHQVYFWLQGKTIVGGLIGGWIGVELTKKIVSVRESTGDAYVFPLIIGMSIGRVGCFLSGLQDDTYGIATNLPWGINFGDGIYRHPTQLYEIAFLVSLGIYIYLRIKNRYKNGYMFRFFILCYFVFRFFVEFIKPHHYEYFHLFTAIQLACVVISIYCILDLSRNYSVKKVGNL